VRNQSPFDFYATDYEYVVTNFNVYGQDTYPVFFTILWVGEGEGVADSEALGNLSVILKTVQQTSHRKYNFNTTLFAIAFIHL
jgi:hypothetical protein